jgi:hypothetical protein
MPHAEASYEETVVKARSVRRVAGSRILSVEWCSVQCTSSRGQWRRLEGVGCHGEMAQMWKKDLCLICTQRGEFYHTYSYHIHYRRARLDSPPSAKDRQVLPAWPLVMRVWRKASGQCPHRWVTFLGSWDGILRAESAALAE